MSYATSNPPRKIGGGGVGAAAGNIWLYIDGDAHGDVDADDYFSNGYDLGMRVGDIVYVMAATGYTVTLHGVRVVTANGAASISAAVLS